jgi:hypothetical protein
MNLRQQYLKAAQVDRFPVDIVRAADASPVRPFACKWAGQIRIRVEAINKVRGQLPSACDLRKQEYERQN